MTSPTPLLASQDHRINLPGLPDGNSTPRLQRVLRNTGALDSLLAAPMYSQVPTNYFSPSYDTPGTPISPRKNYSQVSLGKPRRPFGNPVTDIAPNEGVADTVTRKRRYKLPKSFKIGFMFLACLAILGAIFGIVCAEVFIKRGYFISNRNRVPLYYSDIQLVPASVASPSLQVLAAPATTPKNIPDATTTLRSILNATIDTKTFSSANLINMLSLSGPLHMNLQP